MGIGREHIGSIDHINIGPRIMRANLIGDLKNPTQEVTLPSLANGAGIGIMPSGMETRTKQAAMEME